MRKQQVFPPLAIKLQDFRMAQYGPCFGQRAGHRSWACNRPRAKPGANLPLYSFEFAPSDRPASESPPDLDD